MAHAFDMARNQQCSQVPGVALSRARTLDLVLPAEGRAWQGELSRWVEKEIVVMPQGKERMSHESTSCVLFPVPCTLLCLHLSFMLMAPPPLCFQRYFQHGKFYLKGIFPFSLSPFFFFL